MDGSVRNRSRRSGGQTSIAWQFPTAFAALLLACVVWACAQQQPPPRPPSPPPPAPVPAGPPNYAKGLVGTWYASYPEGPLKATIVLDNRLRGINYVATLVDGNKDMPPGTVAWRGKPDPNVLNLVVGEQLCAEAGHVRVTSVNIMIQVPDADRFTESLSRGGSCRGFPVKWVRVKGQ